MDSTSSKLTSRKRAASTILGLLSVMLVTNGCESKQPGENIADLPMLNEMAQNMAWEIGTIVPPPIISSSSDGSLSVEEDRKPVGIAEIGEN